VLFAQALCGNGLLEELRHFDAQGRLYFGSHFDNVAPHAAVLSPEKVSRSVRAAKMRAAKGVRAKADRLRSQKRTRQVRELHLPSVCGTIEWDDLGPAATSASNYWWLNYDSIPSDIDKDLSEQRVRNARAEWEDNVNWCNALDNSTLDYTYAGRREVTVSTWFDSHNAVDWGRTEDVGGNSNTVAVALWWVNPNQLTIYSCDIRFDTDYAWQNIVSPESMRPNRYDVWNVAAHEVGHCAQFGHVGGETDYSNVLFKYVYYSPYEYATANWGLGPGDAYGNNAKY
jgi:hypothetical protein